MSPIPLVCVPFAGAGASFFYPWNDLAGDELEIVAVQLPGREWRIADEPYQDVSQAADGLFGDLAAELGGSGPVLLFGHSLGAVLAYELAHRFCDEPGFDVLGLMVSGSPGPWTTRARQATGLPDEQFLDRVREFASYDADTMRNPEVRELVLPTLRADVQMHENYVPSRTGRLPAPITSMRGFEDELVSADAAAEWVAATSSRFALRRMDGGHMYLVTDPGQVLRVAKEQVTVAPAR
jgi:surfactin synthase thioesterase subunit